VILVFLVLLAFLDPQTNQRAQAPLDNPDKPESASATRKPIRTRMKPEIIILPILLLIFGCASENCIQDGSRYMRTHAKAVQLSQKQDYTAASEFLAANPSQDDMLHTLDKGMTEHRTGDFDKSTATYAQYLPKFKLSAEAEVSNKTLGSGLSFLGMLLDQITNADVVGTGTYRYAYGLQFRGEKAKYHLSTSEVARVAAFQLMNAMKVDDDNAGRVAMQNLSDMQLFQSGYFKNYQFLDHSFNDILMLTYFGATNDTAGNAAVAFNRAIEAVERAKKIYKEEGQPGRLERDLYSAVNVFNGLYKRNLKRDIALYCHRKRTAIYMTPEEVRSTRLVFQDRYDELRNNIIEQSIVPLLKGMGESYVNTQEGISELLKKNKVSLINGASGSSFGMISVIVEQGNGPLLNDTPTKLNFCLPSSYKLPDNSLTLTLVKNGKQVAKSKLVCVLDPDLLVQLDFQNYLKLQCKRLIDRIRSEETRLCAKIASYYSTLGLLKAKLKKPKDERTKKYLVRQVKNLMNTEPQRRQVDIRSAVRRIKSIRYDHRVWFSQPNKIYMTNLTEVPAGKATIVISSKDKVLKDIPVDIKAGSTTVKVVGKL